jgi:hypothetical protein
MEKRVTFMHIPKTGGTTLRKIILDYSPIQDNVISDWRSEGNSFIKENVLQNIKYIFAHKTFMNYNFEDSLPTIHITMLRDPIERVLSRYYFGVEYQFINPQISLDNWVTQTEFLKETKNLQTRLASGLPSFDDFALLEKAKENLSNHFSVVGITEMFHESLFFINKQLDLNISNSYQILNKTKNRPNQHEISKDTLEKIKKNNDLDIQLYDWSKENLKKKIDELDKKTKKEFSNWMNKKEV